MKLHNTFLTCKTLRLDTVKDFSFELGMKPFIIYIYIYYYHQTHQNYEQPPRPSQNSDFKVIFSVEYWLNLSKFFLL